MKPIHQMNFKYAIGVYNIVYQNITIIELSREYGA